MKSSKIKSFSVYGLFGTRDVCIPFDEDIKILVGENGIGKTQILNIFYYTLTGNFIKLSEFPFDKVKLSLGSEIISFSKTEAIEYIEIICQHPVIQDILNLIGFSQFKILRNYILKGNLIKAQDFIENHPSYNRLKTIATSEDLVFFLHSNLVGNKRKTSLNNDNNLSRNISECAEKIKEFLESDIILYFPTFRRVEEDLRNLGYDDEEFIFSQDDTSLINFGMDDVVAKFEQIEETIKELLSEGLAQFTTDILNLVVDDVPPSNEELLNKINEQDIEILLARVGNQLPPKQKDAIKRIVTKKEFKNPLSGYLLQKLIEIYEKQKKLDDSVKKFRDVCNKYLIEKKVFFDESAIRIFVKSELSGEEIELSKLSSGEKQIISIFSKIYLIDDEEQRFIVLFDEPELSLSILWQRELLPDIINSNKCDFLLAVTHSPFIFENELDRYAVGLNEYVKIAKVSETVTA
ncbi:MAG: ATP-binding protein [Okeania sp. SIO2H7]|nr:ATP-binding protein [Okeania sp. SIO2H7]